MIARLVEISLVQRILLCALGLALLFGGLYSFHLLDIIAYPDPSPPMVELITQNPGWSAEEIERQITIPMEVALTGMPGLTDIRSLSIFGLSDIKVYFDFGTDIFRGPSPTAARDDPIACIWYKRAASPLFHGRPTFVTALPGDDPAHDFPLALLRRKHAAEDVAGNRISTDTGSVEHLVALFL